MLGAPWSRACLHAASAGSSGFQGRERPATGRKEEVVAVSLAREGPGSPRQDGLGRDRALEVARDRDVRVGVHGASGVGAGTCSGAVSGVTGTDSGMGSGTASGIGSGMGNPGSGSGSDSGSTSMIRFG